jgi:hypothetical protein
VGQDAVAGGGIVSTDREIILLDEPPVVFTRDERFLDDIIKGRKLLKPGAVIRLPDDAILCVAPKPKEPAP